MPASHIYQAFDLTLVSDFPLPELGEPRCEMGGGESIQIRSGAPGPRSDHQFRWLERPQIEGAEEYCRCGRNGNTFLLRFHGQADFIVELEPARIVCHPYPELPDATLRHLVLDQAFEGEFPVQHRHHHPPRPWIQAAIHHQQITVVDAGSEHGFAADAQKECAGGMADQLVVEVDPHLHVVIGRRGEAGGHPLAGQGKSQAGSPGLQRKWLVADVHHEQASLPE